MSADRNTGAGMTHEDHLNARLDAEVAALGKPGMTAGELAPLLSDDLQSLYWRRKLDVYFAEELAE